MPVHSIPTKLRYRAALEIMTPERLVELTERLHIETTRASKGELMRQIERSRRLSEERLLGFLSLFELQDLCRALDLDSRGRDSDTLRARILGVPERRATAPRVVQVADVVPHFGPEFYRVKRRRYLQRRAQYLLRRAVSVVGWSAAGGALAYWLVSFLTEQPDLLWNFALGGCGTTALIKIRSMGRFGGIFFYGVPIVVMTYLGYTDGYFDLEVASHSRLAFVWGISLVAGAFIGISEELGHDLR